MVDLGGEKMWHAHSHAYTHTHTRIRMGGPPAKFYLIRQKEAVIKGDSPFFPHFTYNALVRLLSGVATHVHHQHVLRLEGPGTAHALAPETNETLLIARDVLVANVLCRVRNKSQSLNIY